MSEQVHMGAKKRTFLGLLMAILLFITLASIYLLLFAEDLLAPLSRSVILIVIAAVLLCALLLLCGLFLAVFSIIRSRTFWGLDWLTGKTLFLLYPLVVHIGRLLHIAQETIQYSFIAVNNRLVAARPLEAATKDVLLLLPHCLQNDRCPYKITRNPGNCRRCGACQIPDILELAGERGVPLEIVSGGTLARKAVKKHRPRAIVAVACERDLCSGILDSFPLPVYGVVNERPCGPCCNTRVNLSLLQQTLDFIVPPEQFKQPDQKGDCQQNVVV